MTPKKILCLLTLGTHVNMQSLLEHMPETLTEQFKRDLSRLDGQEIAMLSLADKRLIHGILGLHNQELVRQCTMLEGLDPEWAPNLKELVMRKKRGPKTPSVCISGRQFALCLARQINEWKGLTV